MDSKPRRVFQTVMGVFFLGTGLFKLVGLGVAGFTHFLEAAGIPLAPLGAVTVIALEAGGGILLAVSAWVDRLALAGRWVAGLLVVDMAVAIATVGMRGAAGHPLQLDGHAVAGEPWRLPLELVCAASMIYLAWPRRT